jgi:hypothetical protein
MSDLLKQLRDLNRGEGNEAADETERLTAERDALRALIAETLSADDGDYVLGSDLAGRMRAAIDAARKEKT